ncbi:HRDC domain-containing protein [Leifsonia shinshuensis]
MAEHTVIDTPDGYHRALDQIVAGEGPIAVDAERASGFRYSQRAYLIQMFRRGSGTFLFDPPAIGRFDELNEAIAGDEWVLHAATQDLTCLREVGLDPVSIFDTELAARLLGMPRVGLGTVVEELLGIHLAKEHSAADWSTRPLPEPWLDYAALDVELLPDLRDAIEGLLVEAGKTDIARQEFADELTRELAVQRSEPWRRLSGIHSIRGLRNLAVARELWLSRDALAQQLDVAPGRLVPDASLTAAAKAMPDSKRALAAMREFTGRASRTELDRWWSAIEVGRTTEDLPVLRGPGDSLPPPRAWSDRNPEADARLKAARAALTTVAEELSLPLENLLTPDTLRRVAWTPPAEITASTVADALAKHGARRWQIEATSQAIAQAFVESSQTPGDASEAAS